MDFVRAPYKTIADVEREERDALEKQRDTLEKKLADRDARIKELEAALAAKQN